MGQVSPHVQTTTHKRSQLSEVLTIVEINMEISTEATTHTVETTNGVVGDGDHRGHGRTQRDVCENPSCRPSARRDDARGTVVHIPHCIGRQLQGASHKRMSVDGPQVKMNLWQ